MYAYAYLVGCGILAIFWTTIYLKRGDLRKEILWASFAGMPFGVLDYLLVPRCWHPDSLFNLINRFGMGIESFLFLFFMSGLCSVIYEFVFRKKIEKTNKHGSHVLALVAPLAAFFAFAIFFPGEAIYVFIAAGIIGTFFIVLARRDLLLKAIFSGVLFAIFYGFVFFLVVRLFPELVQNFYNLENMAGIFIAGVPLEEILAGLFVGSFWSVSYEYVKSYRIA